MESTTKPLNPTPGSEPDDMLGMLGSGRRRFLALVADVRPELHRYCTRMTGSVTEGEDVVQETLARAYYELSQLTALPPLRPWLFRIAHNLAIDKWRRAAHRATEPLDAALDIAADTAQEPDALLARQQAVRAAISCFLGLAPAQRACVILKDVLDHTLDEIATELTLSLPAVKAALHRGRTGLLALTEAQGVAPPPRTAGSALVQRFAGLFNAHDWDGVRAMLADDVRLDLVSQRKAAGRREVGVYFGNYERAADWHVQPAWLDDREGLAVLDPAQASPARYFIELGWRDAQVNMIRDFRYVPYIGQDGLIDLNASPRSPS